MSKINKKSMNLGFKIIVILAFGLMVMPAIVSAEGGYNYIYSTAQATPAPYYHPNYYPVYPPVTPVVYSYSNTGKSTASPKKTATKANTATPTEADSEVDTPSELAANAIFGANSFMPSGLVQWILVAIFILLIVILARRIFGAREHYDSLPMKHA